MRVSEFWSLMDDEFGRQYARSLARDLALTALGGRSAQEALAAGVDPQGIWEAVCQTQGIPLVRRLGRDRPPRV